MVATSKTTDIVFNNKAKDLALSAKTKFKRMKIILQRLIESILSVCLFCLANKL